MTGRMYNVHVYHYVQCHVQCHVSWPEYQYVNSRCMQIVGIFLLSSLALHSEPPTFLRVTLKSWKQKKV